MKVVDASVVVKWVIEEEGSKEAHRLLEAHLRGDDSLAAPDLMPLEVASAFWKRRRYIPADKAREALVSLFELAIEVYPLDSHLGKRALEIAYDLGISPYDGVYVALAEILSAPLVSADNTLLRAAKRLISIEHIRSL